MVEGINSQNLLQVDNAAFASYAKLYAGIERDFEKAIASYGLPFAEQSPNLTEGSLAARVDALEARGAKVENDCKSIHVNWISPACLTCRKGVGSETYLSSTQCPRHCYFCFNPNQQDYEYYLTHVHDLTGELQARFNSGVRYVDLALTGGEPLVHAEESIAFFQYAAQLYPNAYTRLYTSGSGLTEDVLARLVETGLKEIRFSVKLEDPPALIDDTLAKMEMCLGSIPSVMVEMPVMPDQVPQMKDLLLRLDALGVQGINLLELCFPLHNAEEFAKRGYLLKTPPYRILYDYFYAGGLPIHGSEEACIELLEFVLDEGLKLGVHYCSLENKFTGQVYQQNTYIKMAQPWHTMSTRDYFLKSAKVFGVDVAPVKAWLLAQGEQHFDYDANYDSLEFSLKLLPKLAAVFPSMDVAVCFAIAEERESGPVLRELALQKTTPATFSLADI